LTPNIFDRADFTHYLERLEKRWSDTKHYDSHGLSRRSRQNHLGTDLGSGRADRVKSVLFSARFTAHEKFKITTSTLI